MHYQSIFISDVHLGSRGSKADLLCDFLKNHSCNNLFLVGDIIDGWRLKRKYFWPQSHSNVIRRVLTAAKRDTKVTYVVGNHDDALRDLLPFDIHFGNIELVNQARYTALDGNQYMIIHGDLFDGVLRTRLQWLYHLGDVLYNVLLRLNVVVSRVRNWMGLPYWSLSQYLKNKTKEAVNYVNNFEELITDYCRKQHAQGVICGHVHRAEIKTVGDIVYMNDGDWVESCTALVETLQGEWKIIRWLEQKSSL